MKNVKSVAILGVATCLWFVQGASGSIIVPPLGGQFFVSGSVSTPSPGNEDPVTNLNNLMFNEVVTLTLGIPGPSNWGATFGIDNTIAMGSTTEYRVTKTITNDSGQAWGDFEIFMPNTAIANIDCGDYSPTLSVAHTVNECVTSGGLGTSILFAGMNVPSGVLAADTITITFNMDICATCSGSWQIVQQASPTPEPAALLLTGSGLVILGLWRRQRARGRKTSEGFSIYPV